MMHNDAYVYAYLFIYLWIYLFILVDSGLDIPIAN